MVLKNGIPWTVEERNARAEIYKMPLGRNGEFVMLLKEEEEEKEHKP